MQVKVDLMSDSETRRTLDEVLQDAPMATESGEPIPEHLQDAAIDGHQIKRLAEARIAELDAEIVGLKDQLLRLAAELENTRRRADREKSEAARFGLSGFARDLLSVADIFGRALSDLPEDAGTLDPDKTRALAEGMRMTERELLTVFQRHGVLRLDPKGERFDPNLHQAIAQVPGGGVEKDHVVDVVAFGFVIGERVLRPALVTVSAGGGSA